MCLELSAADGPASPTRRFAQFAIAACRRRETLRHPAEASRAGDAEYASHSILCECARRLDTERAVKAGEAQRSLTTPRADALHAAHTRRPQINFADNVDHEYGFMISVATLGLAVHSHIHHASAGRTRAWRGGRWITAWARPGGTTLVRASRPARSIAGTACGGARERGARPVGLAPMPIGWRSATFQRWSRTARQRERKAKGSPRVVASTPLAAGHRWLSVATAGNARFRRPLSPTSGGPYRRQASVLAFSPHAVLWAAPYC